MALIRRTKQEGIALFMVLAAMAVLSMLVTEFVYIAHVNQQMAYDGLDNIRALYMAKAGFKMSLLRLKAYQQVKMLVSGQNAAIPLPKGFNLDVIWNIPLPYPISTLPGIPKDTLDKFKEFEEKSTFQGKFIATIASGSEGVNLNSFINGFSVAPSPSPQPSGSPSATPSASPSFDPEAAKKGLTDYISQQLDSKIKDDPDFAAEYKDLKIEDLMDGIFAYADRTYERKFNSGREPVKPKRAPFYTLNELHMVFPMDDALFGVLSEGLNTTISEGQNVNTIREPILKAMFPNMTDEDIKEFFKYRDDMEEDHHFKTVDDFYKYLLEKTMAFKHDSKEMDRFKEDLRKRQMAFIVDEKNFVITVQATVNQAVRTLIAHVTLIEPKKGGPTPPPGAPQVPNAPNQKIQTKAGLKVTFMRIL